MTSNDSDYRNERLHAIIRGRVQGVGFRYFVQENAIRLGLSGWVRNRWDGSVEVLAEGKRKDLEVFLGSLRRGPRSSNVTSVVPKWSRNPRARTPNIISKPDSLRDGSFEFGSGPDRSRP